MYISLMSIRSHVLVKGNYVELNVGDKRQLVSSRSCPRSSEPGHWYHSSRAESNCKFSMISKFRFTIYRKPYCIIARVAHYRQDDGETNLGCKHCAADGHHFTREHGVVNQYTSILVVDNSSYWQCAIQYIELIQEGMNRWMKSCASYNHQQHSSHRIYWSRDCPKESRGWMNKCSLLYFSFVHFKWCKPNEN